MKYLSLAVGRLKTNCYIVYDDSGDCIVIDPGAEEHRILSIVNDKKLNVKLVMLTHVHFDHFLAAPGLIAATGAELLVPERDAAALTERTLSMIPADIPELFPDRLLRDGDIVRAGKLEMQVLSTPGHTPGSSCYICGHENVMFSGDTLFAGTIGRTDFPGGSIEEMRQSLDTLRGLKGNYTVLPGHDSATTLDTERTENPFLRCT